jgi:hypothetical protein
MSEALVGRARASLYCILVRDGTIQGENVDSMTT